jgi:phage baseplate assembly protein W
MSNFIGSGWTFPPALDDRRGVALAEGADKIEQAIWIILNTPIGQRVMRPTFGSRLHELVFAPANAETFGLAERYVEEALGFWEPRIDLLDVVVGSDPTRDELLLITIHYRIKNSYDERSLVFPFYKVPGEARANDSRRG